MLINVLGCLFQFLKDASIHPPNVVLMDTCQEARQVCLTTGLKCCLYIADTTGVVVLHSGKQHILSTITEQKLPIFDIY